MENGITVTYSELDTLITNDRTLDVLVAAFKAAARLDYTGKNISFDYGILETAFRIVLPETYKNTLEKLKADKAIEKGIEF